MSEALSVADVRKTLGKAFARAHYAKEVVWVAKHGDPFVAVVSDADGNNVLEIRQVAQMLDMDPSVLLVRLKKLLSEEKEFRDQIAERLCSDSPDLGQDAPPSPVRDAPREAAEANG